MSGDLVAGAAQVHEKARAALRFWLEDTPKEMRFAKDAALNAEIAIRFGAWREAVLASCAKMDGQRDSVRLFTDLGDAEALRYAHEHKAVIERFGRFPSRNVALGRKSTPEEEECLSQPDAGW